MTLFACFLPFVISDTSSSTGLKHWSDTVYIYSASHVVRNVDLLYISLFFVGFDTDTEGDEDIHLCKKCKLVFTNLSDYLQHKVKHDNYKVKLSRTSDRRMLFPQLIQKPEKSEKGSEKENIQRRRRGFNFAVLISMISQMNLLYYLPLKMNNCIKVLG